MKRSAACRVVALVLACSAASGAIATASRAEPPTRWVYPRGDRNPLVPPAALYAEQALPAIEVTLIGVDSHHPDRPLAVVRLDSRPPVRRVVRPGNRVGEYRVLQIRPGRVRVSAPSLGGTSVLDLSVRDSTSSR